MDSSEQLGHETHLLFLNKIPSNCVSSLTEKKIAKQRSAVS